MTTLDLVVTCPYKPEHRIRKSVLQYHLVRCGKNNNVATKVRCPFDAVHVIDEMYFESHLANCASRGNVTKGECDFEPLHELKTVSLEVVKNLTVPVMEDWDEEYVETYDPWKNTETRNIIRCVIGGSKSSKKEFRLAERKRIRALEKPDLMTSKLNRCMKHKAAKRYVNVSCLIRNMRNLYLDDFDTIVQSININKLCINDVDNVFDNGHSIPEVIEKILVQKFKSMVLHRFKKQIPSI